MKTFFCKNEWQNVAWRLTHEKLWLFSMWYAQFCIVHKSEFTLPETVTFYMRSDLQKQEEKSVSVSKKRTDL